MLRPATSNSAPRPVGPSASRSLVGRGFRAVRVCVTRPAPAAGPGLPTTPGVHAEAARSAAPPRAPARKPPPAGDATRVETPTVTVRVCPAEHWNRFHRSMPEVLDDLGHLYVTTEPAATAAAAAAVEPPADLVEALLGAAVSPAAVFRLRLVGHDLSLSPPPRPAERDRHPVVGPVPFGFVIMGELPGLVGPWLTQHAATLT